MTDDHPVNVSKATAQFLAMVTRLGAQYREADSKRDTAAMQRTAVAALGEARRLIKALLPREALSTDDDWLAPQKIFYEIGVAIEDASRGRPPSKRHPLLTALGDSENPFGDMDFGRPGLRNAAMGAAVLAARDAGIMDGAAKVVAEAFGVDRSTAHRASYECDEAVALALRRTMLAELEELDLADRDKGLEALATRYALKFRI